MVVVTLLTNRRKQAPCRSPANENALKSRNPAKTCTPSHPFRRIRAWQKGNAADLGSWALRGQADDPALRPGFQGGSAGFELHEVGQTPGKIDELGLDVLEVRQQDDHEAGVGLPVDDVADPLLAAAMPRFTVPIPLSQRPTQAITRDLAVASLLPREHLGQGLLLEERAVGQGKD